MAYVLPKTLELVPMSDAETDTIYVPVATFDYFNELIPPLGFRVRIGTQLAYDQIGMNAALLEQLREDQAHSLRKRFWYPLRKYLLSRKSKVET